MLIYFFSHKKAERVGPLVDRHGRYKYFYMIPTATTACNIHEVTQHESQYELVRGKMVAISQTAFDCTNSIPFGPCVGQQGALKPQFS